MYVKIDIADTGIGISEQHQGTIFKRFYREDVVHDVDGIGIGLYLAREIVTLQGGYIRVASEVDKAAEAYKKEHGTAPAWMPNQYFAALTNMRSVGVMGDERTYDYAVALRAVNTIDFMTAESAEIPFAVLQTVMSRIINEVRGVNRVFYDLTSKPPGTIEFE